MKHILSIILVCTALCMQTDVFAVEKIVVQGLFSNKAVLMIDGKMHILAVGKTSPEGVKVISADSRGAVLEVDGKQKKYLLGSSSSVSTSFTQRKSKIETIYVNSGGMYKTFGSINGHTVQFLVDTGASTIAMNKVQAKQLGILYDKIGISSGASTASGYVKAYRIRLKTVSVGGITEKNVDAMVIDGDHPGPILLGMTFLGRLNIQHNGSAMTLKQKE